MFPTAGSEGPNGQCKPPTRLGHHDCTAFHHRLKCVSLTAYRLTTFYLTKGLLFWYILNVVKCAPMPVGAFSFYGVRQPCCRFYFVLAGLATRFASDPFVSYIS